MTRYLSATPRIPRLPDPVGVVEQSLSLLHLALAEQPDLIHLFKPKGYGGLAALAKCGLRPQLPLVVDTDDWEGPGGWNDLLPYPAAAKALFAWQERDLPRRADAVTVASHTLESLTWSLGVPRKRVFYLPNGTEAGGWWQAAETLPPATRIPHPVILLYTRFWEIDLGELVAALVAIHQCRSDARLVVVGKGESGEESRLLALAARAGIGQMIGLPGLDAAEHDPICTGYSSPGPCATPGHADQPGPWPGQAA
jgi:hypothetical protein